MRSWIKDHYARGLELLLLGLVLLTGCIDIWTGVDPIRQIEVELALVDKGSRVIEVNGRAYISNAENHTVIVYDFVTGLTTLIAGAFGESGTSDGVGAAARFKNPKGLTYRPGSPAKLYVADSGNCSIREIDLSTNTVSTLAGLTHTCALLDGDTTVARFMYPSDLTLIETDLYVGENFNIRKINLNTLNVTTLAGNGLGHSDGIGTAAKFNYIRGITGFNNKLYISDSRGQCIRELDLATNNVVTIAGSASQIGYQDGVAGAARFSYPEAITHDGSENLYVADRRNHAIRTVNIATGAVTTYWGGPTEATSEVDGASGVGRLMYPVGLHHSPTYGIFFGNSKNIRRIH